jgi:long-chain acyl-CoA synthetase
MLPNCPEFVIAYFAVQKIGGVAVTLNVQSTPYELLHLLGNSDSQCLITQGVLAKRFEEIQKELPLCRHLITTNGQEEGSLFREIIAKGPFTEEIPEMAADDPAVMIYTAGLTGKPLGAVLTHRNLLTQSVLLRTICHFDEQGIGLAVIPFYHSFGAVANMLATLRIGACVVLMERFTLDAIFTAKKSPTSPPYPGSSSACCSTRGPKSTGPIPCRSASRAGRRCLPSSSPSLRSGSASRSWRGMA